jgi:3-hydroxybutyryl-CoA dehydratase
METQMAETNYDQQHGYYIEDISVGMSAIFAKTITDADVTLFAGISGDTNPLHIDENFASQTRFKTRIVHGMLTTSLWSTLVGTRLPGPGSAYVSQKTKFIKPVHAGDTVTAKVTVVKINEEKQRVHLDAECIVAGKIVAAGHSVLWVPKRERNA